MKRLIILFFLFTGAAQAQPYLDIASIRYQYSPDEGLGKNTNINSFNYFNASVNLPLIFKKDSSMVVFSPFVERWDINVKNYAEIPILQSLALPVSFIKPVSSNWSLTLMAIPRWNGYESRLFENSFQMGGAMLWTYKKSSTLKYKFGVYYNSEFFGPLVMPLLGIDWQIDEKNNLFGVLPGNLVFEHKVSRRFSYGGTFRAITNSYQAGYVNTSLIPKYLRIDDNQLNLFADVYLNKNIVLNLEAGHSITRKYRVGVKDVSPQYFYNDKPNANFLFKASLAYRLRFR